MYKFRGLAQYFSYLYTQIRENLKATKFVNETYY